jgi:cytochrome c biogenesis factor
MVHSTLHSISPLSAKNLLSLKPSITSVLKVGALLTPMGAAGAIAVVGTGVLAKEAYDHREQIKSTLHSVSTKVKTDVVNTTSTVVNAGATVTKSVGKGVASVGKEFEKMMIIPLVIGSLVVVMMILKK